MDPLTFQLLGDIADRSPLTLWSVGSVEVFSSLFSSSIELIQRGSYTLKQLEGLLHALLQVGIAHEKAKRIMSSQSASRDQIEQVLMAQFEEKSSTVDASSASALIGKMFLPTILEGLTAAGNPLPTTQIDILSSCMSHLSTCSIQCPSMLAGDDSSLTCLLRTCMHFAQLNNQGNEDISFLKLSALDVLATITNVPQIKRMILKPSSKSPKCVMQGGGDGKSPMLKFLIQGNDESSDQKGVLYVCAELAITGVDDDEENWAEDPASVYDTEASWEDDYAALHAESLLESFVENLGGAATLQPIFQLVDILLGSPSWQNQRAVLSILERCLAAAPATFIPHIGSTVDVTLRLIKSSSNRVQYQALQLLGALCYANTVESEDHPMPSQPILVRENYGDKILEAAAHLIQSPCTKVASHACLTVVSYCRGGNGQPDCMIPLEKNLILSYVGSLLEALKVPLSVDMSQQGLNEGKLTVLIRAIGAIACLADASGEEFLPHYGIMVGLKATMKACPNVRTHELSVLRGAAIEAASIVGQSTSGPDGENASLYAKDASEIMEFATSLLNSEQTDIVPMDQLFAACARIAAVMKSQYVPFMPSILPHILKRATEKLEVSITDSEDNNKQETTERDDEGYNINIPGMGLKKIKINTTQLEEKANSARAIYEHARSLGTEFGPYVAPSADAFLPLLQNEYSGEVRSTSAQALCQIFKASCLAAKEGNGAQSLAPTLLPQLAKALAKQLSQESDDDELENRYAIADALSEVLYDAYTHKMPSGMRVAQISALDAREIVSHVMILIAGCLARRSRLITEMTTDVVDEDELARCEEKLNSEQELLTHLVDTVGYQLKSLGQTFTPIFSQLVAKPLGKLLTSSGTRDDRARLSATCLFDDCVEHCGPEAANNYAPQLLQGIVESLGDPGSDTDLKRASVYGLSQIARNAPNTLSSRLGQDLLHQIFNFCNAPKSDADDAALFENAVSCMASLVLFKGAPLFETISDKGILTKSFLAGLPLEEDFDEAIICHEGLCDMVEMGLININTDYNDLIRIIGGVLSIVAEGYEVASASTCSRLLSIIDRIQQSVDGNSIQRTFSQLDPSAQEALVAAMQ